MGEQSTLQGHDNPGFDHTTIPIQGNCRWFVKCSGKVMYDRGFHSKAEASAWIDAFGSSLDWRAGFVFKIKGSQAEALIVSRSGILAKTR